MRPLAWRTLTLALALGLAGRVSPARAEVEITVDVARRQFTVGEATPVLVAVRGSGRVDAPVFELPDGLQLLGSSRAESHTWINGRMSHEIQFRFEIGGLEPGRYTLGPIDVRADGRVFRSPSIDLNVTAAARSVGPGGGGPASLVVDATPRSPFVGEPVMMRVRLIQRSSLVEDPQYTPPPTPGFWAEAQRQPESYYADEGRSRVLVTETSSRLFPLAAGRATIGEATAVVALALPGASLDPMQWRRGQVPRREFALRSRPVDVNVRALPNGAPAGFDGAVGGFSVRWSADRQRTARDVPFTLRLSVRGHGNIPLLRAPAFDPAEAEVLGQTLEDSLARPGTTEPGRRAFIWTMLPRREGRIVIPAPSFSWFDPHDEVYRTSPPLSLTLGVGPALGAETGDRSGFPAVFASRPVDPRARRPSPWAFAFAGIAMGLAWQLWRSTRTRPDRMANDGDRTRLLARLRAASSTEFWPVAEEGCAWLEASGRPQRAARRAIEAARYGGVRAGETELRRALDGALTHAAPEVARHGIRRLAAAGIALAAVGLAVGFGPRPGGESSGSRLRSADRSARTGQVAAAEASWRALWRDGARHPALAARMAWARLEAGDIASATLWVLRGDRLDARDPALGWVVERVRETGGLVGFARARLPVRQLEWAVAALVFGFVVTWAWPRRSLAFAALALTLVCACVGPFEMWRERAGSRAIMRTATTLAGASLELEPGQVVTILSRDGARARVRAGRDAVGWVPAAAVVPLERAP